ncbi:asparagine synthetase B [Burkholderia singularis]|uniref:asparagine synthase (glutamine-hydrolyzing) n=1 Tax=Burkholderia singularis TaxID=1503053 RepID=A0A103E4I8_9BURK|nr:asparagine synthase (glutamine-hydrolyzing) [Burkholderia singularis]KVE28217.1 asparagine synthetase B [Burkholderia singularis]
MCGITGWVDWGHDLREHVATLRNMTACLVHRGPDASGEWVSARAALGHRRLSIIDPANGAQPMVRHARHRTFVIAYNGELYNTPELRRALESRGCRFETHCDTEVLLQAYIEWGPACLDRLNGIFAFAVWDESDKRLFMARDRIGVKPLFFAKLDSGLLFGSEMKAILAHPQVSREVKVDAFHELLFLGPARTPGSGVFRQIDELKPGWCLTYSPSGIETWQYWKLESHPHEDSFETTVERVRELVVDAVTNQLVSDVPVGTMVSGGLDSSSITAISAGVFKEAGKQLDTYSIDFVDNSTHFKPTDYVPDEDAPWADKVTRHLQTNHRRVLLDTSELISQLGAAMRSRDLPGMWEVDASLQLFCREIKKHSTVVLSGETADEIFGGYRWFHQARDYEVERFPWVRMVDGRERLLAPALRDGLDADALVAEHYRQTIAECPALPGEELGEARRRQMFYINFTRWLPMMLDRKDRASMAEGLEVRVPFCDHRIVEYLWNVPWTMKNAGDREKGLLRHAMQGILPDDVIWRPKSPFPTTHNPKYLHDVRALLTERLRDAASPLRPLLDAAELDRVLAAPDDEARDRHWFGMYAKDAQFLAYLYQIDLWMSEYRVSLV